MLIEILNKHNLQITWFTKNSEISIKMYMDIKEDKHKDDIYGMKPS